MKYLIAVGFLICASIAQAEVLRLGTLKFGTVNWELSTIEAEGFDAAHGFDLQVQTYAGNQATAVAFQAGEVDAIVSDWIWVARQRASGADLIFIPYSKAVGALVVPKDSPARSLADLAGNRIGIAGGPIDKSWLILQAYASKEQGFDLKAQTAQVFGAPPLILQAALQGDTQATINFWHYLAKMDAAGFRPLVTVSDAALALGLDPDLPLLGYVVHGTMAREKPELVAGLAAASREAKALLARDEAAWDRLRPSMNADNDAEFAALKSGYRAGIPADTPVDEGSAQRFLTLMSEWGGADLVGDMTQLPAGLFYGN